MRVFVTGATGFVGSAIVPELINAGHQVLGLTRQEAGERFLAEAGAKFLRGDLEDEDSLRRGASAVDAVIHAGFNHDFSNFAHNCEIDRRAIEVIGQELQGSDRSFVVTAGLPLVAGRLATEEDHASASAGGSPRRSEQTAMLLHEKNVHVSVIRMSQVHDQSKHGLASYMIAVARKKGVSAYVGDGLNRWPAVHRLDAARLYRLALEKGVGGSLYNAVAEQGVIVREIAEGIGRGLNIPVRSLSSEAAAAHFGWLAFPASMDAPASSALTQEKLGWDFKKDSLFLANLRKSEEFNS